MAQQLMNLGNIANDGTGDSHREAFIKVNENFTDLFNSSLIIPGQTNQILFNTDGIADASFNLTIDKNTNLLTVTGNAQVTSNISAANITANSVTVSNIVVSNQVNLGSVANVIITGGNTNTYIKTTGNGNLVYSMPGAATNV
jgi:hypothetical protein